MVTSKSLNAANAKHKYYKNLSADQAALADSVALEIANAILAEPSLTTDIDRVRAAAQIVGSICAQEYYGSDSTKYYRSPYGVFVAGIYTCAGSTRALGRVLDYMGYDWQHVNENQNMHQWCVLTMDGQIGFADGMAGWADYGNMINGMTFSNGMTVFFPG